MKIKIGTGTTVHSGSRKGIGYVALCGAKPNRTGGIMRVAYPVSEEAQITCKKCLAEIAKRELAR